jgi:5-dehydro-4-deoxyglucarate dehydratase
MERAMGPHELRTRLGGALAFPVTPFRDDLSLAERGLADNVERLLQSRIAAIVVAGGTGEFHALSPDEIVRACEVAVEAVAGRVPVIVGTGGSAATGVAVARACAAAGADGLLLMPPAYGRADDDGLMAYYAALASATNLGAIIYARDHAVLSPDLVKRLARIDTVVAFKDGQGDLRLWKRIRDRIGDELCWLAGAGDDLVPQYFSAGAEGFTSSIANLYPAIAVRLFQVASRDVSAAESFVTRHIQPIYTLRAKRRGYEVTTIKAAMGMLGFAAGPVRPPLPGLARADTEDLVRALEALREGDEAIQAEQLAAIDRKVEEGVS